MTTGPIQTNVAAVDEISRQQTVAEALASKHDHAERRLPDKFQHWYVLSSSRKPEDHNPVWNLLHSTFGTKQHFYKEQAVQLIMQQFTINEETADQRLYTMKKEGLIVEV